MSKATKNLTDLKKIGKYEIPVPLLAFTFFFSVFIYLLLLLFCYVQWLWETKAQEYRVIFEEELNAANL